MTRKCAFAVLAAFAAIGCKKSDPCETSRADFAARLNEAKVERWSKTVPEIYGPSWDATWAHSEARVHARYTSLCRALPEADRAAVAKCFARRNSIDALCSGPWNSGEACGEDCKTAFQNMEVKVGDENDLGPKDLAQRGKPIAKHSREKLREAFANANKDADSPKAVANAMTQVLGPPVLKFRGPERLYEWSWFFIENQSCRKFSVTAAGAAVQTEGPGDVEGCWRAP